MVDRGGQLGRRDPPPIPELVVQSDQRGPVAERRDRVHTARRGDQRGRRFLQRTPHIFLAQCCLELLLERRRRHNGHRVRRDRRPEEQKAKDLFHDLPPLGCGTMTAH